MRTALLIDGANMFAASRALGFFIDYTKLKDWLTKQGCEIVRANYYTAVRDTRGTDEHDPLVPLIDWLAFNGYKVVTKPAQEYFTETGSTTKGNMDVEITVDALLMADRIEHFVIGSGDGDFKYLVDTLQRRGLYVSAISTNEVSPPMIATTLRQAVDTFWELKTLIPILRKEHDHREQEPTQTRLLRPSRRTA